MRSGSFWGAALVLAIGIGGLILAANIAAEAGLLK